MFDCFKFNQTWYTCVYNDLSYFDELLEKDSKIRAQDFFNFVIYIARNPNGRHMAWYFIREYWYEIIGK